jgi:uncharacterized protein
MESQKVFFYSEGARIACDLYMPAEGPLKIPALILCHGFAGIKELLLPPYGTRLAQNGYAVLAFDYRGFGESEGERGRLVPSEQMTDIRNAITFMESLDRIDSSRIALWGSSFGGANAIRVAAQDNRVKTLIAQLTFASGDRIVRGKMNTGEREKFDGTLRKMRERAVVQNKVLCVGPEQLISDDDSKSFFSKMIGKYPALNVRIPILTLAHIIEHNPEEVIGQLSKPILIIAAEHDIVCPFHESEVLFERAAGPKKLVVLEGCRHYDAYEGEFFERSVNEITGWLSMYL